MTLESLHISDDRLPLRRFSGMVRAIRKARAKTTKKRVGTSDDHCGGDRRDASRSNDPVLLCAKRSSKSNGGVRVLPFPGVGLTKSNPFRLEPYRWRLKRFSGCLSEFLSDTPKFIVSKREWRSYFRARYLYTCPGAKCSITAIRLASSLFTQTLI